MTGTGTTAGDAWGDFWAGQSNQGEGGCLPARWRTIDDAQRRAWRAFARLLPARAKVLDLATGDGRVMGWLLSARRDLKLMGVDLASHIPDPPRGTRSRGGIAMESLPFADASYGAVVSQFGFEYGEPGAVLAEIRRVCSVGSHVGLMTHRLDGPILEHNLRRREGLLWVLEDAGLIAKARSSLSLRAVGIGVPPVILNAPAEAKGRFGEGSAGWELAEAIARSLSLGRNDRAEEVEPLLARLEGMARNEIGRVDLLHDACRRIADSTAWAETFKQHGFKLLSRVEVCEAGSRQAFADFWTLRHG